MYLASRYLLLSLPRQSLKILTSHHRPAGSFLNIPACAACTSWFTRRAEEVAADHAIFSSGAVLGALAQPSQSLRPPGGRLRQSMP